MQGSQKTKSHASLKSESVWFKTKLISQFLTLSFLLTQPFYLPYLHAAPIGGDVVGGSGSISQTDLTTTINQTSQNLAIDWQSFDVKTNEQVNFVQPNTSSIALNRILGNNGSTIQGQINANGQVILVNPNGVFFTSTATVNVGGIIASSLDMTPADFMNGNYIFNEVLGADGAVVNSGLITASLGGNVALIGKQVKNDGLITAKLGSVVLAAGKQSILTFDNQGLIGVKVTKEILQEELGLEEAVFNSGEINAAGGRVLLTASTSQDVFSQAVNTNSLEQATSVVVNADDSFTLGGGADVLNTGLLDVSSESNDNNAARIVLLGENITSSGSIKADVQNGKAGEIEIHANNKTLLTENSITSAKILSSGQGGLVKILGDKVGLLDNSLVDASGVNGGGEVLIGGDQEGRNNLIRNSQFIYLSDQSQVKADAIDNGDGGKVIAFAENSAKIHGQLFARGGTNGGNGGFIETSGLLGFELTSAPDASAFVGNGGTWLIDPFNISISSSNTNNAIRDDDPAFSFFEAIGSGARIDVDDIVAGLSNGDVIIRTTRTNAGSTGNEAGNITFNSSINFNGIDRSSTLTLDADNDIDTNGRNIRDNTTGSNNDLLNIVFNADSDGVNGGNVIITGSRIETNGGSFTATGVDFTLTGTDIDNIDTTDRTSNNIGDVNLFMIGDITINAGADIITNGGNINIGFLDPGSPPVDIIPNSFTNKGTLNTIGGTNQAGGNITVTTSGLIDIQDTAELKTNGGTAFRNAGLNGGAITLSAGGLVTVDSTQNISTVGSVANHNGNTDDGLGGVGGKVTINSSATNVVITSNIVTRGGNGDGDNNHAGVGGIGGEVDISSDTGSVTVAGINTSGGNGDGNNSGADGGNAGKIILTASTDILLNTDLIAKGGTQAPNSTDGTGNTITLTGNTIINNTLSIDATSQSTNGDLIFNGSISAANDRMQDLALKGKDITIAGNVGSIGTRLNNVSITSTGTVKAETTGPVTAKDFFVNTLNVTQSNNFTAGLINASAADAASTDTLTGANTVIIKSSNTINVGDILTNGGSAPDENAGFNGGGILLAANDITVGTLNSSGSIAASATASDFNGGNAGNISLTATGSVTDDTPTITINGDMNASGGTGTGALGQSGSDGTVDLELIADDAANVAGNITLNHIPDFTSLINIIGSTGADTLQAADRINAWQLTGLNSGNLNTDTIASPTTGITFSGIETITGGTTGNDTLTAFTGDNTWTVDGNGTGIVTGLTRFNNINNLIGNTGKDKFTLSAKITGFIDGVVNTLDTDANTIIAQTGSNLVWNIDSANGGKEENNLLIGNGFSNIHQITGGSGTDNFTYSTSSSSIRDYIDGGAGAGDTLDLSILDAVDVVIGTTITTTSTSDLNINGIETVTDNNDGSTAFISKLSVQAGQNNTWSITDANIGNVVTTDFGTVNFVGFTDLNGSNADVAGDGGNDSFTIDAIGSISGVIDAGTQDANTTPTGRDVLDLSAKGAFTLDVATIGASTKYKNFEEYVGNNSGTNQSKVVGADVASNWTIDGNDSGFVTSGGNTIHFTDFNYIDGGIDDDNFLITVDGSISGLIDGGIATTQDQLTVTSPTGPMNIALGTTQIGNATNITGIERVTGDGANVTLIGENLAQTDWNITGINEGNVNYSQGIVNFFNVSNLTGNTGKDSFMFAIGTAADIKISGVIKGGDSTMTTADNVDMSKITDAFTVTLGTNILGIEEIKANNNATLEGDPTADVNVTTDWLIDTGENDGQVDYVNALGGNESIRFVDFNNIQGQDNFDDVFTITGGDILGKIDGGGGLTGTGIDSVNYVLSDITEVLVGSSTGIGDIEQVIGKAAITLKGVQSAGVVNTWVVENDVSNVLTNGSNDGSVTYDLGVGGLQKLSFVNFGGLEAGTAGDSFTINSSGDFTGTITGGTGDDSFTMLNGSSFTGTIVSGGGTNTYDINAGTLFDGTITGSTTSETVNLTLSGTQSGGLIFNGNATASNTLNIDGDSDNGGNGTDYSGVYTSDIDGLHSDKFVYTNAVNTNQYTIQYSNADTVQDDLIANKLTVNGTQFNDVITLDSTSFQVSHGAFVFVPANQATKVDYSNKTDLTVDTLTNVTPNGDEIKLLTPLDFGTTGTIELKADRLTTAAAAYPLITADELILNSVSNTGTSLTKKLNTNITNLSVINSGALYLEDQSGVNIAELNTAGLLDIVANGDITGLIRNSTTGADLISSGILSLEAQTGSILLNGNNQLTGQLNLLAASGDVELTNTTNTLLGTVTTGNLTVVANGTNTNISQSANTAITSSGLTDLRSSGNITLANVDINSVPVNDFTTLQVGTAQTVTIKDTNRIGLRSVNATSVDITVVEDVFDANGDVPGDNVTASSLILRAGTGIGTLANSIETNVSKIDAITTAGGIYLDNIGDIKLTNLVVSNGGDITLINNGNVEISNVDAGFDIGKFTLRVLGGSVTGITPKDYIAIADIIAFDADILVPGGTFGSGGRPISVRVKNAFDLFSLQSAVKYLYEPAFKRDISTAKISITDAFSNLAGQQLIEIESIGDVDPAIFTDVRNYNHSDIALMMPSDQRYDISDQEEDDEEAKKKREKLINSTP